MKKSIINNRTKSKEILKSFIKDNEIFVNEKTTRRILNKLTHRELSNISLEIIMKGKIIK